MAASYSVMKQNFYKKFSSKETKRNAQSLDITNLKANRTLLADKMCPVTTELKINAVLFAFKFVIP